MGLRSLSWMQRINQDVLDVLGINNDSYEIIDCPTQFDTIIIPEEASFSISAHFKKEWIEYIDEIKKQIAPSDCKKIYLTKTKLQKNTLIGEDILKN